MQTRALHSLAIIPRNLHGVPHSIQFHVDLNTLTRSRSIHNRDKRSLRNAAQPLARCGYIYVTRTQPHSAPSKRTFATLPLRPVLLYIITLRCFPSYFLLFLFLFGRSCGRQNSSSGQYTATPLLCPHAPTTRSLAVLTRFFAPLCGDIPPPRAFRVLFARLPPSPRQLLPPNCRSTPRPASFGSLYSRTRCRGAHFFAFSFHVEHTSCHSPKPQRLSRFLLVYAYLYIASLHVFSPMRLLFPSLRSFPRCRSAADDRASAPLRRFCFRATHRRPACRFRRRSFAFRFSALVPPSFFCFLDLFLPHAPWRTANFLFVFLCFRLFALFLR